VHFQSTSSNDDFARGLIARARDGVRVRVMYDWMGGFGKTSRRFWNELRAGGV
jgi:cardiolipin synthase